MPSSGRRAIFVETSDETMLWELRRAALDRRITLRQLINDVLRDWLVEHGYLPQAIEGSPSADGTTH